jgi:hypothetical protein
MWNKAVNKGKARPKRRPRPNETHNHTESKWGNEAGALVQNNITLLRLAKTGLAFPEASSIPNRKNRKSFFNGIGPKIFDFVGTLTPKVVASCLPSSFKFPKDGPPVAKLRKKKYRAQSPLFRS